MKQYSIGDVQVFEDGMAPDQGGRALGLIMKERLVALRACYRHQPGYVMYVTGKGRVTWDEVRWDTCGPGVTGEEAR